MNTNTTPSPAQAPLPAPFFGLYFMARNPHGRPTLQHMLDIKRTGYTACGTYVVGWSRVYLDEPLNGFLCRRCETHIERKPHVHS